MENNSANETELQGTEEIKNNVEEMESTPIYLGYKPKEFSITWQYENMSLARVGFLHPDNNHLFIQYLLKEFRNRNIKILRITSEFNPIKTNGAEEFPLLDMELQPSFDGMTDLEGTRRNWVQLYLKLISYLNGQDRTTFIPRMKYFKGQEGPLAGYIRAVEEMDESENKKILLRHFQKLQSVKWGLINNEKEETTDYVYHITGVTFKERLESFFLGAWCILNIHYSRDFADENMVTLLTFIQFGKDLITDSLDAEAREIIQTVITYIADLTLPTLDNLNVIQYHALFVQSPTLFPNVYKSLSHMLYGVEKVSDFELSSLIQGMASLIPNEALYRSKVVLGTGEEFIRKVHLPIEY